MLTLRQDLAFSPLEAFCVLIHPTIRIAFSDNDGIKSMHLYACRIYAYKVLARHNIQWNPSITGTIGEFFIERWP